MITYNISFIELSLKNIKEKLDATGFHDPLIIEEIKDINPEMCTYISIDFCQKLFVDRLLRQLAESDLIYQYPKAYAIAYVTILNFGFDLLLLKSEGLEQRGKV